MKVGIQIAVTCLVFGLAGLISIVITYMNRNIYPVVMAITPGLILASLAFFIAPSEDPSPEVAAKDKVKKWWSIAPVKNKILWIISMAAGLAIGFYFTFTLTDFTS